MDTLKEFLSEIKSRLSSPLFASFAIAWIVFNWRIWIPLIFYSQADLKLDNYISYADLIERQTKLLPNLVWPGVVALFYTFIFPYVKVFITVYLTKIETQAQTAILKITGESVMPMSKYIKMKTDYDKKGKELEEIGHERGELITNNNSLRQDLQITTQSVRDKDESIESLNKQIDILRTLNSSARLVGRWRVEYMNLKDIWSITETDIYINSDLTYRIDKVYGHEGLKSFVLILIKDSDGFKKTILEIEKIAGSGLLKFHGSDANGNKIIMAELKD